MSSSVQGTAGSQPAPIAGEAEFEELTRLNNELLTAHRQLYKQSHQLRQLNDEKNLAIGTVAHDLRNPLALMKMQSEFLLQELDGPLTETQRELLSSIHEQGELMLAIVNNLLDVAAIEAGRFELTLVDVPLRDFVAQSVRRNSVLARQKQVDVLLEERTSDDVTVHVDQHKLEQVLNNLITNAVQYSPEGSQVKVAIEHEAETYEIRVMDHGPGIPLERQQSLFRPFVTGGDADVARQQGTGLGLAIVKRIVQRHGGSIDVSSELGRGSCFTVRMPRVPPAASEAAG